MLYHEYALVHIAFILWHEKTSYASALKLPIIFFLDWPLPLVFRAGAETE